MYSLIAPNEFVQLIDSLAYLNPSVFPIYYNPSVDGFRYEQLISPLDKSLSQGFSFLINKVGHYSEIHLITSVYRIR